MKKGIIIAAAFALCSATYAYDLPYLVFQTAAGDEKSVAVDGLEMTISGGKLVVTNNAETQELDLASLKSMKFSDSSSAIQLVNDNNSSVEVFSVLGISCGKFADINDAKASLRPGIYVVKIGAKTQKIAVK